jgi:hypothetical protein
VAQIPPAIADQNTHRTVRAGSDKPKKSPGEETTDGERVQLLIFATRPLSF